MSKATGNLKMTISVELSSKNISQANLNRVLKILKRGIKQQISDDVGFGVEDVSTSDNDIPDLQAKIIVS